VIEQLADVWTLDLAEACEQRFAIATLEQCQRLVWLLARVPAPSARAVLLRRLALSTGAAAAQILRALSSARVGVPTAQIVRLFDEAPLEAVVAAGFAGDPVLVPALMTRLDDPTLGRHAALALAMLNACELSGRIASMIRPHTRDGSGFIVALEVMNDPGVVPQLLELLRTGHDHAWDLHHALWRLTGREPLVPLTADRDASNRATANAWRTFDLDVPPRPRLERLAVDEASGVASFDVIDGDGLIRIDYDSPSPGSTWSRWNKSLFVGPDRWYAVGSDCGTCETTLRLVGYPPPTAAVVAGEIRRLVADAPRLESSSIEALRPYITKLRTGHYLAFLVDLDLEYVASPERSWLARRVMHRVGDDEPEDATAHWLGTEHYQVRAPSLEGVPTFGLVLPAVSLVTLDADTVEASAASIVAGRHPTALVMSWVERKYVRAEFDERFLVSVVLDGHHKLAAYARLDRPARVLAVCRLEETWGPPSDRSLWLRESFAALGAGGKGSA